MVAYEGRLEEGKNIVERVEGAERILLENHGDVVGLETVGFKWNRRGDPECQALAASLLMDIVQNEEIVRDCYERVAQRLPHYINGDYRNGSPSRRQAANWRFKDKAIRYFAGLGYNSGSPGPSTEETSASAASEGNSIEALEFPPLYKS